MAGEGDESLPAASQQAAPTPAASTSASNHPAAALDGPGRTQHIRGLFSQANDVVAQVTAGLGRGVDDREELQHHVEEMAALADDIANFPISLLASSARGPTSKEAAKAVAALNTAGQMLEARCQAIQNGLGVAGVQPLPRPRGEGEGHGTGEVHPLHGAARVARVAGEATDAEERGITCSHHPLTAMRRPLTTTTRHPRPRRRGSWRWRRPMRRTPLRHNRAAPTAFKPPFQSRLLLREFQSPVHRPRAPHHGSQVWRLGGPQGVLQRGL